MNLKKILFALLLLFTITIPFYLFFPSIKLAIGGSLKSTTEQIEENLPFIKIEATYPQFSSIAPHINNDIKSLILSTIDEFKNDELIQYEKAVDKSEYRRGSITIESQIIAANSDHVSIIFNASAYSSGAAHPCAWWKSFNYDLRNNKQVLLADLFANDPLYLEKIALLCRQRLKEGDDIEDKEILDECIDKGTHPKPENYESFTFTYDEITIYFQQYQVCGYSLMPTVTLKRRDIIDVSDTKVLKNQKSFSVLLPINAALKKGTRLNLAVEIPHNFKPIQDPRETFVEFIPDTEHENDWSQIITTQTLIGKQIDCADFLNKIKQSIISGVNEFEIIENSMQSYDSYKCATLTMAYRYRRREIMFARYFSGPFDCSGVQYSIVINDQTSEEEALKRIYDYIDAHTLIVPF